MPTSFHSACWWDCKRSPDRYHRFCNRRPSRIGRRNSLRCSRQPAVPAVPAVPPEAPLVPPVPAVAPPVPPEVPPPEVPPPEVPPPEVPPALVGSPPSPAAPPASVPLLPAAPLLPLLPAAPAALGCVPLLPACAPALPAAAACPELPELPPLASVVVSSSPQPAASIQDIASKTRELNLSDGAIIDSSVFGLGQLHARRNRAPEEARRLRKCKGLRPRSGSAEARADRPIFGQLLLREREAVGVEAPDLGQGHEVAAGCGESDGGKIAACVPGMIILAGARVGRRGDG